MSKSVEAKKQGQSCPTLLFTFNHLKIQHSKIELLNL
jgi:hypothetical protein